MSNSFAEKNVCTGCWRRVVDIQSSINYCHKDSLDNQIARIKIHCMG